MPDLMRIGSVTGWMRATPTAHWLEWQDWADPILKEPFEIKDGYIHPPDRPGNGIAWNEQAIKHYPMKV